MLKQLSIEELPFHLKCYVYELKRCLSSCLIDDRPHHIGHANDNMLLRKNKYNNRPCCYYYNTNNNLCQMFYSLDCSSSESFSSWYCYYK